MNADEHSEECDQWRDAAPGQRGCVCHVWNKGRPAVELDAARPKLLDLFCGQGGAAAGYIAAGWDVTGVDISDHSKRYPADFIQGDALAFLAGFGSTFDAIHASPPCQGYSIATAGNPEARGKHKRLIAATRELLILTGKPRAARWCALITAACAFPVLALVVAWEART